MKKYRLILIEPDWCWLEVKTLFRPWWRFEWSGTREQAEFRIKALSGKPLYESDWI